MPAIKHNRNANAVIDLFSGVGGLSLGCARAGFTISGAVDSDPHAIHTHSINFPNTKHITKNIVDVSGKSLCTKLNLKPEDVAGIIGGPPCQGFSTIGKRLADDKRNSLFMDFFRIVSELTPKFFVAENVPGMLEHKYHDIRKEALLQVSNSYTVLPPITLIANDFGAATTRKRVFFMGYLPDTMNELIDTNFLPPKNISQILVKDALMGLPTKIDPNWQKETQSWRKVRALDKGYFATRIQAKVPKGIGNQEALKRFRMHHKVSGFFGTKHTPEVRLRYATTPCGSYDKISKAYRLKLDGFCPTIRAGTGPDRGSFQAVRPIHPTEPRVINPREAARLQGFPDWFQFSPTKWHSFRQIGNSVSPILAERIFLVFAKALLIKT